MKILKLKQLSIFLFLAVYALSQSACNKDDQPNDFMPTLQKDSDGVIISIPYKWKRSLHKDGKAYSNSIIDAHLVYNGNPIIATTEGDGDRWINLIDIETGQDIWKWNDIYPGYGGYIDIDEVYFFDNLMTFQFGGRGHVINLDNGTTHLNYRSDRSFWQKITGIGTKVFMLGPPKDSLTTYDTDQLSIRDLNDGKDEDFLYTDILFDTDPTSNRVTKIWRVKAYTHTDGKNYLMVVSQDPFPSWGVNQFIGLYDYDNKQWVYNRKMITENQGGTNQIVFDNGKAYMSSGATMNCVDIFTGNIIWQTSGAGAYGFVVKEGKVVGHSAAKQVYCWDAETGQQLWQTEGADISGELRYLNGIVYFKGGSTGLIHAIDISTGKHVWKLQPAKMEPGADRFKTDLYVFEGKNGEKGKIVICSHMNAYLVEPYR